MTAGAGTVLTVVTWIYVTFACSYFVGSEKPGKKQGDWKRNVRSNSPPKGL